MLGRASIFVLAPFDCDAYQSFSDSELALEGACGWTVLISVTSTADCERLDRNDRTLPSRLCTPRPSLNKGRKVGRHAVMVEA